MASVSDLFGISTPTTARRRLSAVRLIAATARRASDGREPLEASLRREQAAAASDARLAAIVPGLWKCEAVSVAAGRRYGTGSADSNLTPLRGGVVPAPALPIAHVGWATGVCQRTGFDARVLTEELASATDERFRGCCFDGIGAVLLVYERPAVRVASRAVGLVHGSISPPDARGHFAAFRGALPAGADRVVAHGYGRMIYVTRLHLDGALHEVPRLPAEWRRPAIQGIAFAFAMVNHHDLSRILDRSAHVPAALAGPFVDGLVYALVFAEWFAPGLLARWQPSGPFEAELVGRAARETALNAARGYPLAFAVSGASAEGP